MKKLPSYDSPCRASADSQSSTPLDALNVILITHQNHLQQVINHLLQCKQIGLDTEANGFYAYYEKICLIQISDGSVNYIIDPLRVEDCTILRSVLECSGIEKVMHDAVNDVSGLYRDFGIYLENLFDTAVACKLLGRKRRSLRSLIEDYTNMSISKKGQHYNWGARPLGAHHIRYAAADVHYLIPVAQKMKKELERQNLLEKAYEMSQDVASTIIPERSFSSNGYAKIKGFATLKPEEKQIVKRLYTWRDQLARRWDRAPFRVLPNETIIKLAYVKPSNEQELKTLKGVPERFRRGGLARALIRLIGEEQSRS